MLLKALREQVSEAGLELRSRRIPYVFGNASGIECREDWWPSSPAAFLMGRYHTVAIHAETRPLARELHDKHFLRKHGRNAYYGQVKTK